MNIHTVTLQTRDGRHPTCPLLTEQLGRSEVPQAIHKYNMYEVCDTSPTCPLPERTMQHCDVSSKIKQRVDPFVTMTM